MDPQGMSWEAVRDPLWPLREEKAVANQQGVTGEKMKRTVAELHHPKLNKADHS